MAGVAGSDPASAIPVMASSTGIGVPAARNAATLTPPGPGSADWFRSTISASRTALALVVFGIGAGLRHLDEQRKIAILPDVVHVVADQPVTVFDAKYKLEDASSSYPNADVYQMLAYCTAMQLPRGWLVYAQGNAPPGIRRVRHRSVDIIQYRSTSLPLRPTSCTKSVCPLGQPSGSHGEEPSTVTAWSRRSCRHNHGSSQPGPSRRRSASSASSTTTSARSVSC